MEPVNLLKFGEVCVYYEAREPVCMGLSISANKSVGICLIFKYLFCFG